MKKNLFKLAGLVISAMLLGACSQLATFENEDLLSNQEAAAKNGFNLTPYGSSGNENARTFPVSGDCTNPANCLTLGVAETFTFTENTGTLVTGANSKVVSATVSLIIGANNMAYYKIDFQSQRTAGTSNADVIFSGTLAGYNFGPTVAGKWNTTNPVTGTYSTPSFDYTTIACGDQFSYSLTEVSNGANGSLSETLTQLAYCDDDCDIVGNEFTGVAVSCGTTREAVYTFGSEDGVGSFKIQGGLTNFTGNATVYINGALVDFNSVSGDGWATGTVGGYTVGQRIPGNSSNKNIRVEGGVGTCDDVVVRVVWSSTNSGGTITGDWTVVDALGAELAPAVAGLTCSL